MAAGAIAIGCTMRPPADPWTVHAEGRLMVASVEAMSLAGPRVIGGDIRATASRSNNGSRHSSAQPLMKHEARPVQRPDTVPADCFTARMAKLRFRSFSSRRYQLPEVVAVRLATRSGVGIGPSKLEREHGLRTVEGPNTLQVRNHEAHHHAWNRAPCRLPVQSDFKLKGISRC